MTMSSVNKSLLWLLLPLLGCYDDPWDHLEGDLAEVRPADTGSDTALEVSTGVPWQPDTGEPLIDIVNCGDPYSVSLQGAPLLFAPTDESVSVSVIVREGNRGLLRLALRDPDRGPWVIQRPPTLLGEDVAEWRVGGLRSAEEREYSVFFEDFEGRSVELFRGTLIPRRPAGQSFSFALITDSHLFTQDLVGEPELTLEQVAENIWNTASPDFLVHLGDILDFHQYGFNLPPPDESAPRHGYLSYRERLGDLLGNTNHFMVIGNWEGENGSYTEEEIARSRGQRLLYMPGPEPTTYAEGGSLDEDYYAFTWGDALFIVLNVMTYTPTAHRLSYATGLPDDWTLGDEQMGWLEETLAAAGAKWRFLLIHHPVGGEAGDPSNSAYGRGGGRAAYIGEQALVHELMMSYGVQVMFYGHDHVFTDMIVDKVHYTLPGSAGAPSNWRFSSSVTGYEEGTYWTDAGHGLVEVTPESVEVRLIGITGELLHSFTL